MWFCQQFTHPRTIQVDRSFIADHSLTHGAAGFRWWTLMSAELSVKAPINVQSLSVPIVQQVFSVRININESPTRQRLRTRSELAVR